VMEGQTILERRQSLKAWRVARETPQTITLPALELQQPGGAVYLFGVDGKIVHSFAAVSRIRRRENILEGYQRPEALAHVGTIRRYMETAEALIPNAVVIAFDDRVRFVPANGQDGGPSRMGTLQIPSMAGEDEPAAGWIVDGQQRLAAVRDAGVDALYLPACGFIGSPEKQAEHFIRVNSTKPLSKELIHALLPHTTGVLSPALEARKVPAALVERLNQDEASPLRGLIQTVTSPFGIAKSTSFLGALENSISDGALFPHVEDMEAMLRILFAWWGAVRNTFPEDWGKKPKESRLFHGAGVFALSLLMDAVADPAKFKPGQALTEKDFARKLALVATACRWSSGTWGFGKDWNEVQNTSQDRQQLATHLVTLYLERSARSRHPRRRKKTA
jgi:DGQHR domain-containing protein